MPGESTHTGVSVSSAVTPMASDAAARRERKQEETRRLRRAVAKSIPRSGLHPLAPKPPVPPGMKTDRGVLTPIHFPGRPR